MEEDELLLHNNFDLFRDLNSIETDHGNVLRIMLWELNISHDLIKFSQ